MAAAGVPRSPPPWGVTQTKEATMSVTTRSPLNKPLAWHIPEMAASIAVHGLLPSLVVRKDKRCKYAIVAERRRLHALQTPVISADETGDCSLCSVYRHHEIGHLIQV